MDGPGRGVRNAGAKQRSAHEEHRQHCDYRRRSKPLEGLIGFHVTAECQDRQACESGQFNRQFLGQEEIDHDRDDGEQEAYFRGHCGLCKYTRSLLQSGRTYYSVCL